MLQLPLPHRFPARLLKARTLLRIRYGRLSGGIPARRILNSSFLILTSYFPRHAGCLTIRKYGFGAFQPSGKSVLASASETEPAMITSSPFFQFTGVATLCL